MKSILKIFQLQFHKNFNKLANLKIRKCFASTNLIVYKLFACLCVCLSVCSQKLVQSTYLSGINVLIEYIVGRVQFVSKNMQLGFSWLVSLYMFEYIPVAKLVAYNKVLTISKVYKAFCCIPLQLILSINYYQVYIYILNQYSQSSRY